MNLHRRRWPRVSTVYFLRKPSRSPSFHITRESMAPFRCHSCNCMSAWFQRWNSHRNHAAKKKTGELHAAAPHWWDPPPTSMLRPRAPVLVRPPPLPPPPPETPARQRQLGSKDMSNVGVQSQSISNIIMAFGEVWISNNDLTMSISLRSRSY